MVLCCQVLFPIQIVYNHTYNAESEYIPVRNAVLTRNPVLKNLMTSHHLLTTPDFASRYLPLCSPSPPQREPTASFPAGHETQARPARSQHQRGLVSGIEGGRHMTQSKHRGQSQVDGTMEKERCTLFSPTAFPELGRSWGWDDMWLFCHCVHC